MKRTLKAVFLSWLLVGICLLVLGVSASSEATVENIDYTPKNPAPQATITFTALITGEDISEVWVIVQECNEELCYLRDNISMNQVSDGEYQIDVALTHDDATYVKYHIDVLSGETWNSSEVKEFDLSASTNGGPTNGGSSGNNTPGFELPLLIFSIGAAFVIHTKKRRK